MRANLSGGKSQAAIQWEGIMWPGGMQQGRQHHQHSAQGRQRPGYARGYFIFTSISFLKGFFNPITSNKNLQLGPETLALKTH